MRCFIKVNNEILSRLDVKDDKSMILLSLMMHDCDPADYSSDQIEIFDQIFNGYSEYVKKYSKVSLIQKTFDSITATNDEMVQTMSKMLISENKILDAYISDIASLIDLLEVDSLKYVERLLECEDEISGHDRVRGLLAIIEAKKTNPASDNLEDKADINKLNSSRCKL